MTPPRQRSTPQHSINAPSPSNFEFVDAGRTFSCDAAPRRPTESEYWWWFRVSTDDRNRYAPFIATPDDTPASVQARVVAYYDDLLARRAAPSVPRWQRKSPA